MNVRELIEALQKCDPESEIEIHAICSCSMTVEQRQPLRPEWRVPVVDIKHDCQCWNDD